MARERHRAAADRRLGRRELSGAVQARQSSPRTAAYRGRASRERVERRRSSRVGAFPEALTVMSDSQGELFERNAHEPEHDPSDALIDLVGKRVVPASGSRRFWDWY